MRRTPKRSKGLSAGHDAGTALNDESFATAEPAEGLHRPAGWDEEPPADEAEGLDEASATAEAEEDPHAPDDALGLYLRQMGAIPLLTREQELALAVRLETKRRRYRHAALSNWRTLDAVWAAKKRCSASGISRRAYFQRQKLSCESWASTGRSNIWLR